MSPMVNYIPTSKKANETRIEPLFDAVFTSVFGTNRSYGTTKNLVNAVLRYTDIAPIDDILRIDAEHTVKETTINCKVPRLDVRIVAENRLFDLEAQRYPSKIANRSLFYTAKLLAANAEEGVDYDDIPQVVVITLLDDKPLFPNSSGFVTVCKPYWDVDGELVLATDKSAQIVVEMSKIRRRYNELTDEVLNDETLAWMYMLTSGYKDAAEVKTMAEKFPTLEEFAQLYGYAINDPEVVRAYERYDSAEREYKARQSYFAQIEEESRAKGLEEGLAEGRAEGRAEGARELAAQLADLGVAPETIEAALASITGK